ncbi:hypothetical protein BGX34_010584 [Mortierella sp. NVP85]|nr:hypothetical protein BGX34_010584 [Mortierella sp. NVP85]
MDSSFSTHSQTLEQRRALAEETVSYTVYLAPVSLSTLDRSRDLFSVGLESAKLTKTLVSSIVADLTKDYIWHKDAFSLRADTWDSEFASHPYLKGETRIGDSLDDEWLIVFILREITKRIPGSVVRVHDNDGEFLLIEAADHIPSWLDPDTSENRVFIYEGNLHIIPIAITDEEKKTFPPAVGTKTKPPKLQDALDLIRSSSSSTTTVSTLANLTIQNAAFGPLISGSGNSQGVHQDQQTFATRKALKQKHIARCQIPLDVARVLKARPELVTMACEAFYTRDALAMASCSRMTKFLPEISSSSVETASASHNISRLGKNRTPFITTAVCFTKTCYAQLMGQQFRPPKIWDGIVLPHNTSEANDPQKTKEAELGMKLTCGFEILCSPDYPEDWGLKNTKNIKLEASSLAKVDFPFATDNGWRNFKNSLSARKYYDNERSGSRLYQELELAAKKQYLERRAEQLRDVNDLESGAPMSYCGHGYHPVHEIDQILSGDLQSSDITSLVDDRKDDDDSWMDVDIQSLEDMMRSRGFGGSTFRQEAQSSHAGLDMQQMLNSIGDFIEKGQGGVEGAEFLDEQSDEGDDEDEDETDREEKGNAESDEDSTEGESFSHGHHEGTLENGMEAENIDDEDEDKDDDIFASDYEERQAKKLATKGGTTAGRGAFVFGKTETKNETKAPQTFAMDNSNFRNILIQTFGEGIASAKPKKTLEQEDQSDQEDADGLKFQGYMEAMDAELSGTTIGLSFEKMPAKPTIKTPSTQSSQADKGKSKLQSSKEAKPEKNLEELMKEHAARLRRGFSRHGPLPTLGNPYGYDPDAIAYEDDEDDGEDENVTVACLAAISPDNKVVGDVMEEIDEGEVVDVDLNLAKNLLESFNSQAGLAGPGGNLLSRLGFILPRDESDSGGGDDDDGDD